MVPSTLSRTMVYYPKRSHGSEVIEHAQVYAYHRWRCISRPQSNRKAWQLQRQRRFSHKILDNKTMLCNAACHDIWEGFLNLFVFLIGLDIFIKLCCASGVHDKFYRKTVHEYCTTKWHWSISWRSNHHQAVQFSGSIEYSWETTILFMFTDETR